MTTVLFAGGGTGGHLFPALALSRALSELQPEWRMVFAGAERGVEARVLPERDVPHRLFPFEPIYRKQWWRNLRWPGLAIRLIREVDDMLDVERPSAVVGTGGYVSGPVVWRAARRGIPTGILELDVRPGFATRQLSTKVREIWLAVDEAREGLPVSARAKAIATGAPIAPPLPTRRAEAVRRFGESLGRPVLVITGGSQGSLALNQVVAAWLQQGGGRDLQVIWLTGYATHTQFAALHAPPSVHVLPFLDPLSEAWSLADIALARAGMMTLAELCAWGVPSILVPLPSAAADHQTQNARVLANAGAAVVIPQADLDANRLSTELSTLIGSPATLTRMSQRARARGRPEAAMDIARRIEVLAGS